MKRSGVVALILAGGCASPTIEPDHTASLLHESGLHFTVTRHSRAPTEDFSWSGTISNQTTDSIRIEYGDCGLEVIAYGEGEEAIWSSAQRGPPDASFIYLCTLQLEARDLAPGASMTPDEFSLSFPVAELLGDSLPEGPYRFEAWFDLADRRVGPLRFDRAVVVR